MARHIFETYVETQPAPMLQKGNVGTLDDLAAHKSEKAAACLRKEGLGSCPLVPPISTRLRVLLELLT